MTVQASLVSGWADWTASSLWQVTWLLLALVGLDLLLRRRGWPQLRMALWMLVPVRLVLPPSVGSPLDVGFAFATDAIGASTATVTGLTAARDVAVGGVSTATVLCAIWALVAAALLFGGWVRRVRTRRLVLCPAARHDVPPWLQECVVACASRLQLRAAPRVVCTPRVAGAAVVGALRPFIAVSTGYLRTASRTDVEHVLLHELAHVRRRDPLQRVAIEVLCALYWFHPAVWLAARRIEDLREVCCDATVASVLRADTDAYRRTLLRAGRMLLDGPRADGTLGWFRRPSQLLTRLAWLEAPTWERPARRRALTTAAIALLLAIAMPSAPRRVDPAWAVPTELRPTEFEPSDAVAEGSATDVDRRPDEPEPAPTPAPTPAGIAAARNLLGRVDDVHGRPSTHQLRAAAAYLVWAGEYDPTSHDDD